MARKRQATAPKSASAHEGAPRARRFVEQRWLIDNIIRANGIDWDQPRTGYLNAPCGIEANGDFNLIRQRVQKFADCSPAFQDAARRREARAHAAQEAGQLVTARENYFMAAVHWGAAQWPFDENNSANLFCNERKRDCYGQYARLADHHVEPVWIPFNGQALPAWFHLPAGYQGGRIPAVVTVPGMDSFKEISVAMYGDRWLNRGIAVLAIDGPGQYESAVLGIPVSVPNWTAAGRAVMDWLAARPELDAQRIGVSGASFGSLFSTLMVAHEPRFKACAVSAPCLEPGCHTIFEEASPTFKQRFMYMAKYADEAAFDEFCRTLTWEGHAERITIPYLCAAGEADELSPLVHAERMLASLKGPRQLVVYQDSRHAIANVPSAVHGPYLPTLIADWMSARLANLPFDSERLFVDAAGRVTKTPI
ncbi:MAG TPA: alpha/beta hydrolase [Xanthobacteraceae bacterium]